MVLTGILIIPLIWTIPFYNFFITRAYTEVLNDAGYDVTSWLDSRPVNRVRVEDLAPAEVYDEPDVVDIDETGDQPTVDLQDSDHDTDLP